MEKTSPKYLDDVEATHMLELLEKEEIQYKVAIHLLLHTGFRRGELMGLEWSDIDFENQVIHVRRSSLYLPDKGVFTDTTKNTTSDRAIKVSAATFDLLREYEAWQAEQRMLIGDQWQQSDRLFTAWNGKPMHPDTLTRWFHKFVRKNKLPQVSIHSLRHTNATLLIANQIPITTVAKRLGHANASTTSKIYAHAIQSADAAAAEALDIILAGPKSSKEKNHTG